MNILRKVRENLLRGLGILMMATMLVVALNTDIRSNVRGALIPKYRVVLAVAQADLDSSGESKQILKVKTHDGIYLEVYGKNKSGLFGMQQELLASAKLPDQKDGYFTFNGEVTNLAVDVIDQEKNPKILATSFDDDLVAHINIYRYLPGHKDLQLARLN